MDKDVKKLMKKHNFTLKKLSKHCLVFTNGNDRIQTSKTTSDGRKRIKNLKCALARMGYK